MQSLAGAMSRSETVVTDTVLMAIDESSSNGGLLGKKLEHVVVDTAAN